MSCYYPRLAYRQFKDQEGKWKIKFIPERADYNISRLRHKYGDDLLLIPCGSCLGCKFDKARDWATRAVLEMQYHDEACFITLTYDDRHYPGKLVNHHLIDFIKTLRNRGAKFSYLGCGELGSTTRRAHYHLILFGFRPDDLEFYSISEGNNLYTSVSLSDAWKKGYVLVGDCTYQSAGYVARYTTKKITDDDCFLVCSNRPAIGYRYYVDHASEMVKTGYVYGDFGAKIKQPLPRYFEKLLMVDYPDEYDLLIKERLRKVNIVQSNDLVLHRFAHVEQSKILAAGALDRKLSRFTRR